MTAINWRAVQARLGVPADGVPGRVTYGALLRRMGAGDLAEEIGAGMAAHLGPIAETPLRLAHFLGQMAHESGGFRFMVEIWGPTPTQLRYEGSRALGNTQPGDGKRFLGRGLIQITGRWNYGYFGKTLGVDLLNNPALAADPVIAVRVARAYWDWKRCTRWADADNVLNVSKAINQGSVTAPGDPNGLADRRARTARAKELLA